METPGGLARGRTIAAVGTVDRMTPYRGPDARRIHPQAGVVQQYAGQTGIWRQYISASAGVSDAGFGFTQSYREQIVTGIFGVRPNLPMLFERQGGGGTLAAGTVQVSLMVKPAVQDEIEWNGELYRVESEPVRAQMAGFWVCQLKRGEM